MLKKLALSAAGLALLASPLVASAQTVDASNPNAALIAALISLVQILEQQIQQLIAQKGGTTPPNPILCPTGQHSNGSQCISDSGALSATIDSSSLTTGSATPTITGKFTSMTGSPEVVISSQPLSPFGSNSSLVWSDAGDHGGGLVFNGTTFSDIVTVPLQSGTYHVGIYNKVAQYTPSSEGNLQYTQTLVTEGTLIVTGYNGNNSSASIDQSSLAATTCVSGVYSGCKDATAVTITGSASNVSQVIVNIKGQTPGYATVVNGRWSATIGNVFPNTYTVQVDDNDSDSNNGLVLAKGTLTVTGSNITLANNTKLSVAVPSPVTIGGAYTVSWSTISGPTLAQILAQYPNATGELIAYNSNNSIGVAQTIQNNIPASQLQSDRGVFNWTVGLNTNDGRPLPSGSYFISFVVSVPVGVGVSDAVAQGNSTVFTINAGTSKTSVSLTAQPSQGSAPFAVGFGVHGLQSSAQYSIDYGDGNNSGVLSITPQGVAVSVHFYQQSGTYAANLEDASGNVLATQIITVTNGS